MDGVRDVLMFVPGNNGGCINVPVDEAKNEQYVVLIT